MFSPPDYSAPRNFTSPRLGPWTALLYLHRQPLLDAVKAAAPFLTGKLLDVGCGNKPYAGLLSADFCIGVDVTSSPHSRHSIDVIYDGMTLPFFDQQFDAVLCTEVLEHSPNHLRVVSEIGRVLKPGGHALIAAPMVFHHHEEPWDFQRFTRFGMELMAKQAGLCVVWVRPRGGVFSTLVALVYTTIFHCLSRRPFVDVMLWGMWPFAALAAKLDRRQDVPISLGWQMLARKL